MVESMKFYIVKQPKGERVYLNFQADTRKQLAGLIGGRYFLIEKDGIWYDVNDVVAEPDGKNTATGAIIGGLLGLVAGGAGAIVSASFGGIIGNVSDEQDKRKVEIFNSSRA